MPTRSESRSPRLVAVDLSRWGPLEAPAEGAVRAVGLGELPAPFDRLGAVGGPALALGVLLRAARTPDAGDAGPLVLSVGAAVVAGLPTAARASVSARSPLSGRLAEGQVGSDLGRRLAAHLDALVLEGRLADGPGVLWLDPRGVPRLLRRPDLAGLGPGPARRALQAELGDVEVLRVGPGGEAGVPFANLAAGGDPPSFVGRGGLGAALAAHGLKAVAVSAPEADLEVSGTDAAVEARLRAALLDSPRLAARSAGGTLELFHAARARGDASDPALASGVGRGPEDHHGCKGCPTPCGWAFRSPGGERSVARFGALSALGPQLGLDDADLVRDLLARCNELGLDAREAGARLSVHVERARAEGRAPDRARLLAWLDGLLDDPSAGAAAGAAAGPAPEARRATRDRAAWLGQAVGLRGADPMRTFPFLVGEGARPAAVRALLAPVPLPAEALDPLADAGKGRLVWWHENLVTALDALGFCAFSAAGLLTDGALDLDGLAALLLPGRVAEAVGDVGRAGEGSSAGAALLALGASLDLGVAELHRAWGVAPGPVPAELEAPGLLPEYRRFRGLGEDGRPTDAARAVWGGTGLLELWRVGDALDRSLIDQGQAPPRQDPGAARGVAGGAAAESGVSDGGGAPDGSPSSGSSEPVTRAPGRVTLRGGPALGVRLGPDHVLELRLALPAPVREVLRAAGEARPRAAGWLLRDGEPLPGVWRDGRPLGADEPVGDGDRLELVLAVAGG